MRWSRGHRENTQKRRPDKRERDAAKTSKAKVVMAVHLYDNTHHVGRWYNIAVGLLSGEYKELGTGRLFFGP